MIERPSRLLPICLLLLSAWLPGCGSLHLSPVPFEAERIAAWRTFDHGDLAAVLEAHVDEQGRVDYAALEQQRGVLDRYVATLAEVGPDTHPELFPDQAHALAYHLNAYNALVLFNVLEHPGLESVHEQLFDFFYLSSFRLDGDEINLYDLENDVLRGYGDARIHFALNCASLGCPRLPREPFEGDLLEQQLDRETTYFLGEPRNVAVHDGVLQLSAIFEWYDEDFAPEPASWVLQRRAGELPEFAGVEYLEYDWRLNAQQP